MQNHLLANDAEHLDRILSQALEQATTFLSSLDKRSAGVRPNFKAEKCLASRSLPTKGLGAEATLKVFEQRYAAGISGSAGSRYLGFVTGGSTPAAIAGDWLVSTFDQNVSGSVDSSAPYVEREALHWLAQLFGLPDAHRGTFVTGATMANFVGLAIGRQWVAHQIGVDVAEGGLYSLPRIKILSGCPHSCVFKALSMLGMGRKSLQLVSCLPEREAVDLSELRKELQLSASTGEACIVVANAGTVNTGDFDDLVAIAELKHEFNFWLHIDAAFGGFAACSPKYSHLVKGLGAADSITIDAHKWLNVPYDSAMQFTRHRQLQIEVFQNKGAYLGAISTGNPDFVHLTPENSRRLRALPAWFSLVAYGSEGYCDIVEQNCETARSLGEKIAQSPEFVLLAPVRLNVVCFALTDPERDQRHFLDAVNEKGQVFMTASIYNGVPAIRAAFSNWRTQSADVEIAWDSLLRTYHEKHIPE